MFVTCFNEVLKQNRILSANLTGRQINCTVWTALVFISISPSFQEHRHSLFFLWFHSRCICKFAFLLFERPRQVGRLWEPGRERHANGVRPKPDGGMRMSRIRLRLGGRTKLKTFVSSGQTIDVIVRFVHCRTCSNVRSANRRSSRTNCSFASLSEPFRALCWRKRFSSASGHHPTLLCVSCLTDVYPPISTQFDRIRNVRTWTRTIVDKRTDKRTNERMNVDMLTWQKAPEYLISSSLTFWGFVVQISNGLSRISLFS